MGQQRVEAPGIVQHQIVQRQVVAGALHGRIPIPPAPNIRGGPEYAGVAGEFRMRPNGSLAPVG